MKMKIIFCFIFLLTCAGCSSLIRGYQTQNQQEKNQSTNKNKSFLSMLLNDNSDENDQNNNNIQNDNNRLPKSLKKNNQNRKIDMSMALTPLHLIKVDGNTWRTAANPAIVYSIMARILSQNYMITSVDRKNLNIQTDWDKFFIQGRLFRNRISVTVFPVGARQTEVVIKNSVEYYSGIVAKQSENTAWLPSPDLTDEVNKLIENTDKQTIYAYSQNVMR